MFPWDGEIVSNLINIFNNHIKAIETGVQLLIGLSGKGTEPMGLNF